MAPKKEDKLAGRRILAPPSVWPDFPCPKGQKGWAGVVGKKKDSKTHFVTFPDSGDTSKYFFSNEDITRWLVEEEEEEAAAPAKAAPTKAAPAKAAPSGKTAAGKAAAGSGRAAAAAPASSHKGAASGSAAAKRKEAAGGSQQQQEARPSKKGKGPAVAADNTQSMTEEALRQLILSTIEGLDKEQLRTVYREALKVKLGRR